MAKYLILIYDNEAEWEAVGEARNTDIMAGHEAFSAYAGDAVLGGDALRATTTATSMRTGLGGEVSVTDGPFVETKEALGGYYVVEARDLDHALDLAKRVPTIAGGVEVRPVMVFG